MNIRVWQYYRDNIDDIRCMHLVITVLMSLVLLSMGRATHAGVQKTNPKLPPMKINWGGSGSNGFRGSGLHGIVRRCMPWGVPAAAVGLWRVLGIRGCSRRSGWTQGGIRKNHRNGVPRGGFVRVQGSPEESPFFFFPRRS